MGNNLSVHPPDDYQFLNGSYQHSHRQNYFDDKCLRKLEALKDKTITSSQTTPDLFERTNINNSLKRVLVSKNSIDNVNDDYLGMNYTHDSNTILPTKSVSDESILDSMAKLSIVPRVNTNLFHDTTFEYTVLDPSISQLDAFQNERHLLPRTDNKLDFNEPQDSSLKTATEPISIQRKDTNNQKETYKFFTSSHLPFSSSSSIVSLMPWSSSLPPTFGNDMGSDYFRPFTENTVYSDHPRDKFDNGYLQDDDKVLNQGMLENAIKTDMKRNRSRTGNLTKNKRSKLLSNEEVNHMHSQIDLKDDVLQINRLCFDSETRKKRLSGNSVKLLKDFSGSNLRSPSLESPLYIESSHSISTSFIPSSDNDDNNDSESIRYGNGTNVIDVVLKWRDALYTREKFVLVSIISEDIVKVLYGDHSYFRTSNQIPMHFNTVENEWFIPNLSLPPGIYELNFLINQKDVRYSNYLPTATNEFGSIVNWFEVPPGVESIEPFKEVVGTCVNKDSRNSSEKEILSDFLSGIPLRPRSYSTDSFTSIVTDHSLLLNPNALKYTTKEDNKSKNKPHENNYSLSKLSLLPIPKDTEPKYSNEIPELFKITDEDQKLDDNFEQFGFVEPPSYGEPCFDNDVVDCNQDILFATLQQNGAVDAPIAEQIFLKRYPVPDLPVYLNSQYLNRIFNDETPNSTVSNNSDADTGQSVNHIIPHVNLNHLLTSKMSNSMISVVCSTRYRGKFVTQVLYSPIEHENVIS